MRGMAHSSIYALMVSFKLESAFTAGSALDGTPNVGNLQNWTGALIKQYGMDLSAFF